MTHKKVNVGIIGCGAISPAYFKFCKDFDILQIAACSDLDMDRAKARATEFNIPKVCTPEQLLADPEIEIVVNLTVPKVHAQVDLQILQAGKHVYSEKPFSITRQEGQQVLDLAAKRNLLVGCAPDTFLGGSLQTCRKILDSGLIGTPTAFTGFMMCGGHECWHPNPEFYYQVGGGPMFDMGPYYLTALINSLGPVARVAGSTKITFPTRTITSQPKYGKDMKVEVPTHVISLLEFANGVSGTLTTSFDVFYAEQQMGIEIYGTHGTLKVPDPNCLGGPVRFRILGMEQWMQLPHTHGYTEDSRGLGVVDMAYALRTGRPYRANGRLAFHVVDIMESIHEAAAEGKYITLSTTCDKPAPLPLGLKHGMLDE